MPEEKSFLTLQSQENLIKTDITLLAIEARGWAGSLFRRLSRNDGDIIQIYNNFIEIFFQLYLSLKHNVEKTNKIEDWKEKMEIYDKLFYNDLLHGKFMPEKVLKYFDIFMSDMIKCGIYDLSTGEFYGKGDLW